MVVTLLILSLHPGTYFICKYSLLFFSLSGRGLRIIAIRSSVRGFTRYSGSLKAERHRIDRDATVLARKMAFRGND